MSAEPIILEETFNASVEKVWKAITDKDEMKQWYFDVMESFKPEVGFETNFNLHYNGKDYLHQWKVLEVIPLKKLVYSWKFGGYEGDSYIVWELSSENNLTKLKFTHNFIKSFPQEYPEFSRESHLEGWTAIIKSSLKDYLENK